MRGETGYPFVDAGMRELNETGFMHNRVRMLSEVFCANICLSIGAWERPICQKLLDYEMASNVGNWQWVAGCGVDAAPTFGFLILPSKSKSLTKTMHTSKNGCQITKHHLIQSKLSIIKWHVNDAWKLINRP